MAEERTLAYLHWEKLVQNNDFAQADRFYEKMKQEQQLDAEICFVMGLWYRQQQQYDKVTCHQQLQIPFATPEKEKNGTQQQ